MHPAKISKAVKGIVTSLARKGRLTIVPDLNTIEAQTLKSATGFINAITQGSAKVAALEESLTSGSANPIKKATTSFFNSKLFQKFHERTSSSASTSSTVTAMTSAHAEPSSALEEKTVVAPIVEEKPSMEDSSLMEEKPSTIEEVRERQAELSQQSGRSPALETSQFSSQLDQAVKVGGPDSDFFLDDHSSNPTSTDAVAEKKSSAIVYQNRNAFVNSSALSLTNYLPSSTKQEDEALLGGAIFHHPINTLRSSLDAISEAAIAGSPSDAVPDFFSPGPPDETSRVFFNYSDDKQPVDTLPSPGMMEPMTATFGMDTTMETTKNFFDFDDKRLDSPVGRIDADVSLDRSPGSNNYNSDRSNTNNNNNNNNTSNLFNFDAKPLDQPPLDGMDGEAAAPPKPKNFFDFDEKQDIVPSSEPSVPSSSLSGATAKNKNKDDDDDADSIDFIIDTVYPSAAANRLETS